MQGSGFRVYGKENGIYYIGFGLMDKKRKLLFRFWGNGKENGNYFLGLGGLGFRV